MYLTIDEVNKLINELNRCLDLPLELMKETYLRIQNIYNGNSLKIGSKYAGGIVFYIDESGKHGFVVAEEKYKCEAIWGEYHKAIGTKDIRVWMFKYWTYC